MTYGHDWRDGKWMHLAHGCMSKIITTDNGCERCKLPYGHEGEHRSNTYTWTGDQIMDTNATLTVKVDRVKEAAASCPDAKRVLEKLFPEAFAVKFNPGDFVKGYGGEGIIPHEDINETLDKRFGPRGTNVRYISLHTGASHTDPAHAVVKIVKPQFLK